MKKKYFILAAILALASTILALTTNHYSDANSPPVLKNFSLNSERTKLRLHLDIKESGRYDFQLVFSDISEGKSTTPKFLQSLMGDRINSSGIKKIDDKINYGSPIDVCLTVISATILDGFRNRECTKKTQFNATSVYGFHKLIREMELKSGSYIVELQNNQNSHDFERFKVMFLISNSFGSK